MSNMSHLMSTLSTTVMMWLAFLTMATKLNT